MKTLHIAWLLFGLTVSAFAQEATISTNLGIFESASDIGAPAVKGSVTCDAAKGEYRITGGGANVWTNHDEFFYVWRKLKGNVDLEATIRFEGAGGEAHRMAGLMIRQSLDPGSPNIEGVVHGNGLTIIKYRETTNDITRAVRFPVQGPTRLRFERRGSWFTLYAGKEGQPLAEQGSVQIKLPGPIYAGLAVCPHAAEGSVTIVFSDIKVEHAASK